MKIEIKIEQWQKAGLLTYEQSEKILAFEKQESSERNPQMILYAFLMLGVSVVSIGIISVIATNWAFIPDSIKLGGMFLVLASLACGAYTAFLKEKKILFEVLQNGLALFCFGGISLISQIFHTGGEFYQAISFWLVIVAPLALMANRIFLPAVWTAIFVMNLFFWIFNPHSIWGKYFLQDFTLAPAASILLICFFVAFVTGLTTQSTKLSLLTKGFDWWWRSLMVVTLVVTDYAISFSSFRNQNISHFISSAGILLPLSILGIWINKNALSREKILVGIFILASFLVYLPILSGDEYTYSKHEFLGASYFIFAAFMLAIYHAVGGRFKFFRSMTLLIGIRFLIIYFQVFKDLAQTGFGLIFSGVLIIILTYGWFKMRRKIEEQVKEVLK